MFRGGLSLGPRSFKGGRVQCLLGGVVEEPLRRGAWGANKNGWSGPAWPCSSVRDASQGYAPAGLGARL